MYNEKLKYAKELLIKYGAMINDASEIKVTQKSGISDLVTDMDVAVERLLFKDLKKTYPGDTFFGEEIEQVISNDMWILDPIDGTTNFIATKRDFAISLAYYSNMKAVFGLVYDVKRDEMFVGISGEGASLNGVALPTLKNKAMEECLLDISLTSMNRIERELGIDMRKVDGKIRGHRALGCASLSICHVAQGLLDIAISANLKCWDYAAAAIILNEVGGHYKILGDYFSTDKTIAIFTCKEDFLSLIK